MNRIIFPLQPQMKGECVADLQDALQLLLKKGVFNLIDPERAALEGSLRFERAISTFGATTGNLVKLFQEQRNLTASGEVDEPTAKALNTVLEELGVFVTGIPEYQRLVGGQIRREDAQPVSGTLVRAFYVSDQGMLRLGDDITDAKGNYTIRYNMLPGIAAINLQVIVFDATGKPLVESELITSARPLEIVDLVVPGRDYASFQVVGKVASRVSAGVRGLLVKIVDKVVGGEVLLAEAVTDERGEYQATFSEVELQERGKVRPDLQSRVFSGETFLAASDVRYNASNYETLNVLLDETAVSAMQSEYETLIFTLSNHFEGALGDLRETDDQRDITYLANKTGWDARAVALTALAAQFSAKTADADGVAGIQPAFFYALFRAGLPANESTLYQTYPKTVEDIWEQAIAQGIIPASLEGGIPAAVEQFRIITAERALDSPALVGVSSLREMLSVSLFEDVELQDQFADIYTQNRDDLPKFWEAVRTEFGEDVEAHLKLDGQLAYLTLNNAQLISNLHAAAEQTGNGLTSILNLVDGDYYRAEKWQEVLGNLPIPPEIPGESDDEKRNRYAELLAAQVRLSFPTAVVGRMVENGETQLMDKQLIDSVSSFLNQHQGSFEIGRVPVEQYIQKNLPIAPGVAPEIAPEVAPGVIKEVKRIQRVYQITPSDEAMNWLLRRDVAVDSAYAVTRYDRNEFIRIFKGHVGGEANARLIYARSQQVYNTVLNIAVSYLTACNAPGIGINIPDPAQYINPQPTNPTMESLLGGMDYCSCQHCRSILSPAAYLVDLLHFCDQPPNEENNPLNVLRRRRPDIQHLPLTCENTNTPLPYIDLVNETLEFYIYNNLDMDDYLGHTNNGEATPEELLAAPQRDENSIKFSDTAYNILAGKTDPPPLLPPAPPLPFHQPLENLRRYFDRFEAPLAAVMEALREDDHLDRGTPDREAKEYGWRDILMEELHFSRAEYKLLTVTVDPADPTVTNGLLQQLYGYPQETSEDAVLDELSNVKKFTRRVGISYEDIIEILRTRFINPNSALIPKLERLGVPFIILKQLKDGTITETDFENALAPALDPTQYGDNIKEWIMTNYDKIMSLITLTYPNGPDKVCSLEKIEFRYADPDNNTNDNNTNKVHLFEFVRLIRFIRLWKKLGWTIEQTDKAITALYPADQIPDNLMDDTNYADNLQRLDAGFLKMLPRLGVLKRVMGSLKLKPEKDLPPLLACFAPIDTHGAMSLYRQMFLSPSMLQQDGEFADDGYGNFPADNTQILTDHAQILRSAFLLTDDEFARITTALGFDDDTPLTMENITEIFRRGWLARKLKLSVREFLLLTRFTNLNPFSAPDIADPPDPARPVLPAILLLIQLVDRLRSASLKPVQALYLIWNQDINGKSAPEEDEILSFARTLRSDIAAIESEFALIDDPDGGIARSRMSLVYGSDTTDTFFALLNNTLVTEVPYNHGQPTLEQSILEAGQGYIAYDNLRKMLSYKAGVMPDATRDALKAVTGTTDTFKDAVDELYEKTRMLFDSFPKLLPLYKTYITSSDPEEKKRSELLEKILLQIKPQRKRQQALQAVSAATKVEVGFAMAMLDNADVLQAMGDYIPPEATDDNIPPGVTNIHPALDDLTALEKPGLSAQFFFGDIATGEVGPPSDAEADLAYASSSGNSLPDPEPEGAVSGIWSGYLEAPANNLYKFRIETDEAATVTMSLGGEAVTLVQNGNVWSNEGSIELRAGTLYAISFKVENVTDMLAIRWETSGRDPEIIPGRYLYSLTLVDHLRHVYIRFLKAASLAVALKLTATETAYLASHEDYRINEQGWLNSLPVTGSPDTDMSVKLHERLNLLLDFARLKAALAPDDERLLTIIKDPAASTKDPDSLLFTVARWEPDSVDSLLIRFKKVLPDGQADCSALKELNMFCRVYDAYKWVKKLGLSASALIEATTNEPDAATVRHLQSALRARYDESDWLKVLKPINDQMRSLQRDALVAYILHQMRSSSEEDKKRIDTPDKLFEYFLMDVQMEPIVQTSRIRHALSSVQLFIERCLMNLEQPEVAPSSARQWEWMKRYRVWEANRKVFLYPENWLEPELRDDQSSFFKETMSELLQSDITEDRASVALLNYLSKLEEVAKLEPCGIHFVEKDLSKDKEAVTHVVARTAGAGRKYFYRRREHGPWTPWEQIKLDIEDNPVIPVVWKDRLLLFWLKILKQSPVDPQTMSTASSNTNPISNLSLQSIRADAKTNAQQNIKITVQAVLCWSEYYNGKWQPTKTSDVNHPLTLGRFDPAGSSSFNRSSLMLEVGNDSDALRINIHGDSIFGNPSFLLYNTHSLPAINVPPDSNGFAIFQPYRELSISDGKFTIYYHSACTYGSPLNHGFFTEVLENKNKVSLTGRTIAPTHILNNPWNAPFFYEDNLHVFYVTTADHMVTIPEYNQYILTPALQKPDFAISQLVHPELPPELLPRPIPDIYGPIFQGPGFGVVNQSPIRLFISEDAFINVGIATAGTVSFGDVQIGPAGSLISLT